MPKPPQNVAASVRTRLLNYARAHDQEPYSLRRDYATGDDGPSRELKPGVAAGSAIAELWDAMARDPDRRALEQEALNPAAPV
jgi:hypothetical protein